MATRVGTIESYRRLPVSPSANPRFEITLTDGTVLRTEPDGAVNYDVENFSPNTHNRPAPRLRITTNRSGLVTHLEPLTPRGQQS